VSEQNEDAPKRRYRWPWFVLAAFILFVALAVLWLHFEVRTVEQERNLNAPPPGNATH
jgi:bacteriorhodopsin